MPALRPPVDGYRRWIRRERAPGRNRRASWTKLGGDGPTCRTSPGRPRVTFRISPRRDVLTEGMGTLSSPRGSLFIERCGRLGQRNP